MKKQLFFLVLFLICGMGYAQTGFSKLENTKAFNEIKKTIKQSDELCPSLSIPWQEDFENLDFPPECWNIGNFFDSHEEWKRTPNAYNSTGAAFHDYCVDETCINILYTPKIFIDNTGHFALEFWSRIGDHEYMEYSAIYVYVEGEEEGKEVYVLNNEPNWRRIVVPLNEYRGKTIEIGFAYVGEMAHTWTIDNVKIHNVSDIIDGELYAIIAPQSQNTDLTIKEDVIVQIKNNGGVPLSGFQVKLEVDNQEIITDNFVGELAGLETAEYTFSVPADFSRARDYTIKTTLIIEGDVDLTNNSKTKIITNVICNPIRTFPWREDFSRLSLFSDVFPACWKNIDADGDGFSWFIFELPDTKKVATSMSTDHGAPRFPDNWLITPQIALGSVNRTLKFAIGALNPVDFRENYSVLISTTGTNLLDFTEIHTETLTASPLKIVSLSLEDYAGQMVYIAFRHHGSSNESGLDLTDIEIAGQTVSISDMIRPDNNSLKAWIQNEKLYVNGLTIGERLSIYNINGQLIYQSIANNDEMIVNLNVRGHYIIQSGRNVVKVVF
jgi:hypothetical protein